MADLYMHPDPIDSDDASESGTSEDASGSDDTGSWISWFCSLKGNEFFCEVDEDYIQDDFNLSGLSSQVPYYDYALDMILDAESPSNEIFTEEQHELIESAAEMLYGLVHVRYILTGRGMQAMLEKYKACEFGRCPRVLCNGQPCLPVGTSDVARQTTVKVFCPRCEDIYFPRSKYQGNIDGAYFGTTFPHLFLLTYPQLRPAQRGGGGGGGGEKYVPKIFGFKLHPTAYNRPGQAAGEAAGGRRSSVAAGAGGSQQQQQQQGAAGGGGGGAKRSADKDQQQQVAAKGSSGGKAPADSPMVS